MPQITEPAVAVNLHKVTPEGSTVVAEICVPMSMGVYACENTARSVAEAWVNDGFTVTYGSHSFDGKSGLYQTSVYGYLPNTTEETEEA